MAKTEEQRAIFFQLLRLSRNRHTCLPREERRKVLIYINKVLDNGGELYDCFGLNKVLLSLQAIQIASEEIDLRGDVLKAYLLSSIEPRESDLTALSKTFSSEIATTISHFRRAATLLESKPKTMESDDFRNLFIATCEDMRVVLMLIADCVNKMRQIKDSENDKARQKVSIEAAHIYAPLAHKLGLYTLKSELEDLSLKYLEHDAYYHIKDKLNETKKSRDAYIERFITPIKKKLDEEGLKYHIKGRTKSIHSIWQKMKKQHCAFEGVYDLFAIRIIIDAPLKEEQAQCWKVFSLITYEYESNLKRLRDWLTVPKSNGYESLHITVRGPEDKWVEVQIRSERMDEVAEHGLAAHWRYKGVKTSEGSIDNWLADIRAALETGNESALTNNLTRSLGDQSVYVFSPKGDLYRLPKGATLLDFAYLIHTGVGNRCVGGRIDGKNVSIRHKLESGQKVEILTRDSQTPKPEWMNIVVSQRAKAKIRSAVNDLAAAEGVAAREILERKLKNRKLPWDESIWNQLIKRLGYKETNEFYKAFVGGQIDVAELIENYSSMLKRESHPAENIATRSAEEFNAEHLSAHIESGSDVLVIDKNLKGLDFQMAHCCNPVYGDTVFGFVTSGGGIKIHRTNCPNAPALLSRFPYRVVKARWAGKGTGKYPITLRVVGNDDLGIVNNITSIISKEQNIMLRSISIDSNDGLFSGVLTVMVDDKQVLNTLIKKLRTVKGVKAVSRN